MFPGLTLAGAFPYSCDMEHDLHYGGALPACPPTTYRDRRQEAARHAPPFGVPTAAAAYQGAAYSLLSLVALPTSTPTPSTYSPNSILQFTTEGSVEWRDGVEGWTGGHMPLH